MMEKYIQSIHTHSLYRYDSYLYRLYTVRHTTVGVAAYSTLHSHVNILSYFWLTEEVVYRQNSTSKILNTSENS